VAPDLTGMGAHPRAELLVDIVDPNREIDPSFIAFDFETKKGEIFQGIIARENAKTVLVRDAAGEHELAKSELTGRRELGRSLMPEGFEALGAETLRDIIAYLQSGDSRFQVVDLRAACTADSRAGIFMSAQQKSDTLHFKRFGDVRVGGVPFVIIDPATTNDGKNLIVLRGGQGMAKSYPVRVEVPMDHAQADVLEILGGVGGWAFPCCGDEKGDGLPAAKITVVYDDGAREELVFKNGVEFADYVRPHDVPGSKSAAELVKGQQVRVIRRPLTKSGTMQKLIIESFDNRVAPVFVAITAERSESRGNSANPTPSN
jgi:putative heme-binding domain-containing protein